MEELTADLHLHTVLSPCGDLLMTPGNIIDHALEIGLDIIAITDHNSAENVEVAVQLAQNKPLTVVPGMEVTTVEEVHLICLFANIEQALEWQEIVYHALPDLKNNEEVFGPQIITDLNDQYVKKLDRLLLTATELTVSEVIKQVKKLDGIVIPAHVDKQNYSLLSNLGFIPSDLNLSTIEISPSINLEDAEARFQQLEDYAIITSSDAHYIEDIRQSIKVKVKENRILELQESVTDRASILLY
ncbi:PHP domain-containing protein [Halanaerocella petrolearia]